MDDLAIRDLTRADFDVCDDRAASQRTQHKVCIYIAHQHNKGEGNALADPHIIRRTSVGKMNLS
jgi:hypothetical protein